MSAADVIASLPWRVSGRTLYAVNPKGKDLRVGWILDEQIAALVCEAHNRLLAETEG
jgi:hypothetical protein